MLAQEAVLAAIKDGRKSAIAMIDPRDYARLIEFFPAEEWTHFGFSLQEGASHTPVDWTEGNVREQLARDVLFGINKAKNERGISSSLMYEVVKTWMWIMEDDLQYHDNYHSYGLPFFREVAEKYGIKDREE